MIRFHFSSKEQLLSLTSLREGETKAGEKFQTLKENSLEAIVKSSAKFVVFGIPEDIGIRANYGISGASQMWSLALKKLCNVQHTDFFNAENVLVLGEVETSDLMKEAENASVEKLRDITAKVDERVFPVMEAIAKAGKEAIIVGGGHNNSYPLLKGCSMALDKPMNCINIDPHADLRLREGRHSGNGFSYALNEKYLDHYFVMGLHENYNSQYLLDQFKNNEKLMFYSFEDWLKGEIIWEECFEEIYDAASGKPFGLEFDLDAIAGFPSSAATPSGFSENDARIMIHHVALNFKLKYFHIAEGAPELLNGKADLAAKMVAFMITDYVKARTVA